MFSKVETIDINCKIMISDCVGAKTLLVAFVRYRPDYRHIQMHRFAFIDSLSYLMVVLLKRYKTNIPFSKNTEEDFKANTQIQIEESFNSKIISGVI